MLEPDARFLMTDALRPPEGLHLDIAVATTYSLSLSSMILAPLAMAAHNQVSGGADNKPDPVALLESVRRYARRTTVFCHAGAIHVPATYQRIVAFAEQSVVEVRPESAGKVFHPKIWVLRFTDQDEKSYQHRFICMSRNLTEDRSWDTVLVMDESVGGVGAKAAPLISFLKALPSLTLPGKPLSEDRQTQIASLTESLKRVRFEVPSPFETAELWPLGIPGGRPWRFPDDVEDLFVVSPFVDAGFLEDMPYAPEPWLVSRPETLDHLGSDAIPEGCIPYVMQRAAETAELDAVKEPSRLEVRSGLHAKTFVWEIGRDGYVLTGSANATRAAFSGNIEFSVLLSGPRASCGTSMMLAVSDGHKKKSRTRDLVFQDLIETYEISSDEPSTDSSYQAERVIEAFHSLIAAQEITVAAEHDGDRFRLSITMPEVDEPKGSRTTVRPLGVKRPMRSLGETLVWRPVAEEDISPFIVLETSLNTKGATVIRGCVVKASLVGDPAMRHRMILSNLLGSEKNILRYLALLLADPRFDSPGKGTQEPVSEGRSVKGRSHRTGRNDMLVFEPLLRAAARQDGSLKQLEGVFMELRDEHGAVPHLSKEFQQLWAVVWDAVKEFQA